jgi:hypothetical protein
MRPRRAGLSRAEPAAVAVKAPGRATGAALAVVLLLGPIMGAAAAEAAPTLDELHAAECVAALEARAETLAAQVRAGQPELKPQLLVQLEYGAAFIGRAYLKGERDEARSQSLLDAARARQHALPDADLHRRQALCADEASHLLASTNGFGRVVVARVAERRMNRMLEH